MDKRTDIWAFGSILYRMLAGKPALTGETVADTIAAILAAEVDMAALPSHVPPRVRGLVARCLERSTKARLRDIADARPDLEDDADASAGAPAPLAGGAPREVQEQVKYADWSPDGREPLHQLVERHLEALLRVCPSASPGSTGRCRRWWSG